MRLFRLGVLVSACAVAFVPGAAAASPHISISGPESEACPVDHIVLNVSYTCAAEFTLSASNGYRITVSGNPAAGPPGSIELTAESPNASVVYIAPETLTPKGVIKASFGRLGKLSLRFHPSGKVRRVRVPKKCLKERPPVVTSRLGTFVGTFRFRGEQGYTGVSTHRVAGGIGDPLAITPKKLECEIHESDAERAEEDKSVGLDAGERSSGVTFEASASGPRLTSSSESSTPASDGDIFFMVVVGEKAEGMRILRFVGAVGPAGDFAFDASLTSATISPPPPFAGTGSFFRNADGCTSWSGSLSVPVPGLGEVRLAEAGFKAELATQATLLQQLEERIEAS